MTTIKRPLNCVDDRTVRWSLIFLWRENYMDDVAKWILYEDDMLLVLRKPAGIAVESAKVTEKDLISMLRIYTGNHVFMVHRLDQVVEGVIAFAKTRQAAAALSGQLNNGVMKKRYTARICGKVRDEAGVLTDCLVRDKRQNMSKVGKATDPGAVKAELRYRRLSDEELEIELVTGRHHQIRAQLSHAGMPIAGDRKYGAVPEPGRQARGAIDLCASELTLRHPVSGELMSFKAVPSWHRQQPSSVH